MSQSLTAHLTAEFESVARSLVGVSRKKMFGCEAFFRDGTIFGLIWKEGRIGLKLVKPESYQALMAIKGSTTWSPGKMTMGHWVLSAERLHDDEALLRHWITKAHQEITLAPQKPAKKKPAPKKKPLAKRA
jgi:TfoX/Sxy family transcriptional regulator of competence genes